MCFDQLLLISLLQHDVLTLFVCVFVDEVHQLIQIALLYLLTPVRTLELVSDDVLTSHWLLQHLQVFQWVGVRHFDLGLLGVQNLQSLFLRGLFGSDFLSGGGEVGGDWGDALLFLLSPEDFLVELLLGVEGAVDCEGVDWVLQNVEDFVIGIYEIT